MILHITTFDDSKAFVEYEFLVFDGNHSWRFRRRYSLLRELHFRLAKLCSSLPAFPPKKFFGNKRPAFLQARLQALQEYFAQLMKVPEVILSPIFIAFFTPEDRVRLPSKQLPRVIREEAAHAKYLESLSHLAETVSGQLVNMNIGLSPTDREELQARQQNYEPVLKSLQLPHESRLGYELAAAGEVDRTLFSWVSLKFSEAEAVYAKAAISPARLVTSL